MAQHARKPLLFCATALIFCLLLQGCGTSPFGGQKTMAADMPLSPRLERLFEHTKLVCFGRYAMQVPVEAKVIYGSVWFPSKVKIIKGGLPAMKRQIEKDLAEIRNKDKTHEIVSNEQGPVPDSWQIRWYSSDTAKQCNSLLFQTYVNRGDLSFSFHDTIGDDEANPDAAIARQRILAQSIHVRDENEAPMTPGFCIDKGFFSDDRYDGQEMVQAGIYLPSFPDISFSLESNKNAYADYKEANLKKRKGLLKKIAEIRKDMGFSFPRLKVFREQARDVNHWAGEEFLVRRPDAVHEFDWEFVGRPRDVANPSVFRIKLYSKVAHNTVGAADKAALTDEEAVALWDKLLGSLKFRVQVPGAPEGSYYYPAP